MLLTGQKTALVSSTDLKRKYQKVKELLKQNKIIIISNRKSEEPADGIFIPYSEEMILRLEDLLEDLEMEKNKKQLVKEFKKSYNSGEKKRTKLSEL